MCCVGVVLIFSCVVWCCSGLVFVCVTCFSAQVRGSSCSRLSVVRVVCCVVLFLSGVCVCDLFLFTGTWSRSSHSLTPRVKGLGFPPTVLSWHLVHRYVVSLEPQFDAAGRSLAPSLDRAVFASLRTPQVYISLCICMHLCVCVCILIYRGIQI